MKTPAFVLALDADRWQVARSYQGDVELREVTVEDAAEPLESAAEVRKALDELGYKGQGVCLGLPSERVLAGRINCGNLPRKQRRTAMLYRLEEQIPIEAERLTAAFLPAIGGQALGLAVETAPVRSLVDELFGAGVSTVAICPTALLSLWGHLQDAQPSDYAILTDATRADVFRLANGQPDAWHTARPEPSQVARCLQIDMLSRTLGPDRPTALVVGPLAEEVKAAIEDDVAAVALAGQRDSTISAAARAAGQRLAGGAAGWVDLRQGKLATSSLWSRLGGLIRLAAALFVVLMVTLAGTLLCRGASYETVAAGYRGRQSAEYRRLYPNGRIPLNVKSRLGSELKRLSGISGLGFELPDRPSALETLCRLAGNLPEPVRLRIVELRVGPTGILIEGQARTHTDAEIISRSLAEGGFAMDPPRSEHLAAGGVSFTLAGAQGRPPSVAREGDKP